jgi:hypothetical protein
VGGANAGVNAAQLGSRVGAFGSYSGEVGSVAGDVAPIIGLYSGLRQGGLGGDAQAALSAYQLGSEAGLFGGSSAFTGASAVGGLTGNVAPLTASELGLDSSAGTAAASTGAGAGTGAGSAAGGSTLGAAAAFALPAAVIALGPFNALGLPDAPADIAEFAQSNYDQTKSQYDAVVSGRMPAGGGGIQALRASLSQAQQLLDILHTKGVNAARQYAATMFGSGPAPGGTTPRASQHQA